MHAEPIRRDTLKSRPAHWDAVIHGSNQMGLGFCSCASRLPNHIRNTCLHIFSLVVSSPWAMVNGSAAAKLDSPLTLFRMGCLWFTPVPSLWPAASTLHSRTMKPKATLPVGLL
ncbi:hypothetical protein N657DRAFT_475595 [Parathielavia appendiculata]|uniref:Uncharacterized protein n=1 Tax=Parathielavia appendiculata TaxID=2587402 RepID=A0AAN6TY61_9PEZI|nr:hypothetical protein N657DRAFT_475595 [Parathielavia appendiculata]